MQALFGGKYTTPPPPLTHTYTCDGVYTKVHTPLHMHASTHTGAIPIYAHSVSAYAYVNTAHARACVHYMHTRARACIRAYTHTHTTCMRARMRPRMRAYIHSRARAFIHAHRRSCMRAHVHNTRGLAPARDGKKNEMEIRFFGKNLFFLGLFSNRF